MGYNVRWMIENRVVLVQYTDAIDAPAFAETQQAILALLDTTPQDNIAHIYVDMTALETIGMSPLQMLNDRGLQAIMKHRTTKPSGRGIFVAIPNPVHNFFVRLLAKFDANLKVVRTHTEGLAYLSHFVNVPDSARSELLPTPPTE
jgi:hypothetical protein